MNDKVVGSMKEALELIKKFKEEGKYDLFRGQAKNWEVMSSAVRTNDVSRVIKEIENFGYFCANNELLKPYINLDKSNEFIAIAQHYGLKTNFIDFTSSPEVAMYFATHDKSCEVGQQNVIVCLNRKEFENDVSSGGFIHFLLSKQNLPIPCIIDVDLTNLWRLKAQKGCFLELLLGSFDSKIYDFDRIFFPYSEPFDGIQKKDIYPERKSPIEIEIDKFFMDMRMIKSQETLKQIMANLVHHEIVIDYSTVVKIQNIIFKDISTLQKHYSWETIDNKWNDERQIKWEYQSNRSQIQVDIQKLISSDSVYFNQFVNTIAEHRNTLINIEIINTKHFNSNISEKLERLFDGMNVLPYSNIQIASAIKELLNIEMNFNKNDKVEVELGERNSGGGYYTRSFILEQDYQYLLREDILEYINLEFLSKYEISEDIIKNVSESIISSACDIRLISDFNKLVDLFAMRIIPFQIYLNRNTILFNPAKIRIFGRA
jgi:transcription termination factor NusB